MAYLVEDALVAYLEIYFVYLEIYFMDSIPGYMFCKLQQHHHFFSFLLTPLFLGTGTCCSA